MIKKRPVKLLSPNCDVDSNNLSSVEPGATPIRSGQAGMKMPASSRHHKKSPVKLSRAERGCPRKTNLEVFNDVVFQGQSRLLEASLAPEVAPLRGIPKKSSGKLVRPERGCPRKRKLPITTEIQDHGQSGGGQATLGPVPAIVGGLDKINGAPGTLLSAGLPPSEVVVDGVADSNEENQGQRRIVRTALRIGNEKTRENKNLAASIRTRARKNLIINNFNSKCACALSLRSAPGETATLRRSFFPERKEEKKSVEEELPLVTLTDEEYEALQREKKKSESHKAKLRRLRKPPPIIEEASSLSTLFNPDTEARARMIAIFENEYGDQVLAALKRRLRAEVFRVYRIEREKITKGNRYFVAPSEKNIAAANNLAKACIFYELTPIQFIQYWLDPKNNFTRMAFPPLAFIGTSTNVDTVVCTLTPLVSISLSKTVPRRGFSILGHTYEVTDLHPDLRRTLLAAGHDLTGWDNRALMSVQNFTIDTFYDWPIEDFAPELQPLIRSARPLYADREGGK